jgi:uncharacterized protein YegP (UPF0339 family)
MGYHVYRDRQSEYRWYYQASNGRTISVSSEGYVNKSDCLRSIEIMKTEGSRAPVYDDTAAAASYYR